MTHLIGRNLDGYRIIEQIHGASQESGEPPEAHVYRAATLDGQRSVAVKLFALSSADAERIQRLGEALTAVSHLRYPGVPEILGSGVIEGRPYVVMPYLAAGSLADRLSSGMALSLDAGELLNQVAAVLSQAHQGRIVHGDLKPSKLLFDEASGALHVIGLGEAAARPSTLDNHSAASAAYRAPELGTGAAPTPATDQYAFGVLTLELLTQVDPAEAMSALRAGSVGKQDLAGLGISPETAMVLSKATAVDPGRRFADLSEANRALQISIGNLQPVAGAAPDPEPSSPAPGRRRKPRRLRFGLAAVFILLLGLVGTIPALSAGLIKLPEVSFGNPSSSGRTTSAGEGGIALPTAAPTDWLGETDAQLVPAGEGSAPTEPPGGSAALEAAPTPTPSASPTPTREPSAPTNTALPPAKAPPPADTRSPPTSTSAPADPTMNPKKCKDDPSHQNYCTPTP